MPGWPPDDSNLLGLVGKTELTAGARSPDDVPSTFAFRDIVVHSRAEGKWKLFLLLYSCDPIAGGEAKNVATSSAFPKFEQHNESQQVQTRVLNHGLKSWFVAPELSAVSRPFPIWPSRQAMIQISCDL